MLLIVLIMHDHHPPASDSIWGCNIYFVAKNTEGGSGYYCYILLRRSKKGSKKVENTKSKRTCSFGLSDKTNTIAQRCARIQQYLCMRHNRNPQNFSPCSSRCIDHTCIIVMHASFLFEEFSDVVLLRNNVLKHKVYIACYRTQPSFCATIQDACVE